MHTRDGTGQDFLDPTGKFQNHRRLIGRSNGPVDRFFTEGFSSLFNVFNEKFSKEGAWSEVLKIVTLDGGLRKKKRKKIFAFFAKMTQL